MSKYTIPETAKLIVRPELKTYLLFGEENIHHVCKIQEVSNKGNYHKCVICGKSKANWSFSTLTGRIKVCDNCYYDVKLPSWMPKILSIILNSTDKKCPVCKSYLINKYHNHKKCRKKLIEADFKRKGLVYKYINKN
jgi:hypothetical protein